MEITVGRKGNQKFPITEPTVSKEHCRITPMPDGTFVVENLSANGTKVDGRPIIKTTARRDSILTLGPVFSASIAQLLGLNMKPAQSAGFAGAAAGAPGQGNAPEPKTYNISHLHKIYEDFNNKNIEVAEKQRKINLIRTGIGIFTLCAMPTIFFLGPLGLAPLGYSLTGVGIVGNIYSFVGMKNSETIQERQKRQEDFEDAWVCPNPDCNKSLPAKSYKMLKKNFQSCPYCKSKFVEK